MRSTILATIKDRAGDFQRFIETGTADGARLESVAHLFKIAISVEINVKAAGQASRRLHNNKSVRVIAGDSPAFLRIVIDPAMATLFLLDAHYTHGAEVVAPQMKQCPLLEELAAICSFKWSAPYLILIDSLHLYQPFFRHRRMAAKGYRLAEWPTEDDIRKLVGDNGCSVRTIADTLLVERKV